MKTETSKATHTTGPWHIQDNTADPCGQLRVDSAAFGAVAVCYTMEKGETRAPAECIQSARLISAAPELLEALVSLLNVESAALWGARLTHSNTGLDVLYHFNKARAAIAKATGTDIG